MLGSLNPILFLETGPIQADRDGRDAIRHELGFRDGLEGKPAQVQKAEHPAIRHREQGANPVSQGPLIGALEQEGEQIKGAVTRMHHLRPNLRVHTEACELGGVPSFERKEGGPEHGAEFPLHHVGDSGFVDPNLTQNSALGVHHRDHVRTFVVGVDFQAIGAFGHPVKGFSEQEMPQPEGLLLFEIRPQQLHLKITFLGQDQLLPFQRKR